MADDTFDYEDDTTVSQETVSRISEAVKRGRKIELQEASAKAALDKLTDQRKRIYEVEIPGLMREAKVKSIQTDTGLTVTLKDSVKAKISKPNEEEAFKWMEEHGHSGFIKHTVTAVMGRGETEKAKKLAAELAAQGVITQEERWVESQTLIKFVKDRLADGDDLPLKAFGVFKTVEAVIKDSD